MKSLFEGHPVDMALRYANVVKLMFFTAAVSPILPVGLPMSFLGLLILYWVDKYLLLRRYTCKNYLDDDEHIAIVYSIFQYRKYVDIFIKTSPPKR